MSLSSRRLAGATRMWRPARHRCAWPTAITSSSTTPGAARASRNPSAPDPHPRAVLAALWPGGLMRVRVASGLSAGVGGAGRRGPSAHPGPRARSVVAAGRLPLDGGEHIGRHRVQRPAGAAPPAPLPAAPPSQPPNSLCVALRSLCFCRACHYETVNSCRYRSSRRRTRWRTRRTPSVCTTAGATRWWARRSSASSASRARSANEHT